MKNRKKITVIDLFSGCGGLSYGFVEAGFDVILGIDNWQDSLETFSKNHPGSKTCLTNLETAKPFDISKKYGIKKGSVGVIIGGPPCQGFSIAGKRNEDDPRNRLYKSFLNFVKFFKPRAFVIENVPNLVSMGGGKIKNEIVSDFGRLGYTVNYEILLASDYGVPQNRRRVVFVGLLGNKKFSFPEKTYGKGLKKHVTAKDAISDLPENGLAGGSSYFSDPKSDYQRLMRRGSKNVFNHDATVHSDQTKSIISMVPDGGNYKNLPKHLHSTRKVNIAWTRLNSSKPSFTIDTGHNHHFHYKYNRVPTARESARLQSFPDKFIFSGTKTSQLKQVGNAVPPLLGKEIAMKLIKYI